MVLEGKPASIRLAFKEEIVKAQNQQVLSTRRRKLLVLDLHC